MLGGIQLESNRAPIDVGRFGTLGCIARTNEQNPRIVALTCQHNVAGEREPRGELDALSTTNRIEFIGSIPSPWLVVVTCRLHASDTTQPDAEILNAFYVTKPTDTLDDVARSVAAAVNNAAAPNAYLAATHDGVRVLLALRPGPGNPHAAFALDAQVSGTLGRDFNAALRSIVDGDEIRFERNGDDISGHGVYTYVNRGRSHPSYGVFAATKEQDTPADIGNAIVSAITRHNLPVPAIAGGEGVSIRNAQALECEIATDLKVGHPNALLCWSPCCDHDIGTVIDARHDLDVALVRLPRAEESQAEA